MILMFCQIKKIKEAVYQILNEILQIGRHHRISCIVTNNLPTNFQWTRIILNSHIVVYFPAAATNKVKYMLQTYVDLEPEQIKYFKKVWFEMGSSLQTLSTIIFN